MKLMSQPFVSIIMPTYNTESEYLHESVKSILNQSYTNFELIIIDDGSYPAAKIVLSDITDKRMVYIENQKNSGLPYSLNKAIKSSRGKYIFRMDSDDISLPERVQKEVAFLEDNKDIDVVASFAKTFGSKEVLYSSYTKDEEIRAELLWKNPIIHPTVAFRVDSLRRKKILYKEGIVSEDFEMWSRMAFSEGCRFAVIPEVLLMYRLHEGQVTAKKRKQLRTSSEKILEETFKKIGIKYEKKMLQLYSKLQFEGNLTIKEIKEVTIFMKTILSSKTISIDNRVLKQIYKKALIKHGLKEKNIYAILRGVVL